MRADDAIDGNFQWQWDQQRDGCLYQGYQQNTDYVQPIRPYFEEQPPVKLKITVFLFVFHE